jgi:hypothetical protein
MAFDATTTTSYTDQVFHLLATGAGTGDEVAAVANGPVYYAVGATQPAVGVQGFPREKNEEFIILIASADKVWVRSVTGAVSVSVTVKRV